MIRLAITLLFWLAACGAALAQPAPGTSCGPGRACTAASFNATGAAGYNGWAPLFTTLGASGTASIGTGYATGDEVTLNDGCSTHTVVVVTATTGGAAPQWYVSTPGSCSSLPTSAVGQLSTTGSGSGATFTLTGYPQPQFATAGNANGITLYGYKAGAGLLNVTLGPTCFGWETCGAGINGATWGTGGGTGLSGAESTLVGYSVGSQLTTGNWVSGFGHNACGFEIDGAALECYGVDDEKFGIHNNHVASFGSNTGKFSWNAGQNFLAGDNTLLGPGLLPTVSGAANNGSGLIRLTVSSTTSMSSGDCVFVGQVGGTTEANTSGGNCVYINVIDGTHLDEQGSTFTNTYTSGGNVLDMQGGFINIAVGGTQSNGGLIELLLKNTLGLRTGMTAHVANVGGTTEANGTWTITARDFNCTSSTATCRIDLQSSTYSNAWTSGGQITVLQGAYESVAAGYSIANASMTGALYQSTLIGNQQAASAVALSNVTLLGANCGPTNLGATQGTYDVIMVCTGQSVMDVTTSLAAHAIGIGSGIQLPSQSVVIGGLAGSGFTTTSASANETIVGYHAGSKITTGTGEVIIGPLVASTTLQTGASDIIIGVNSSADAPTSSTANWFGLFGASSTPSISIAGTNSPTTATTTIHGSTLALPDIANNTGAQTGTVCWSSTTLTYDGTNTCLVSSIRFKRDVKPIPLHGALAEIDAFQPVSFLYKSDKTDDPHFGLIAESVAKIDPRLVANDSEGKPLKVKYIDSIALTMAAIKELSEKVANDEYEIRSIRRSIGGR